ncbi:MAG: hypothetical protein ACXACC_09175 [Promethearchaeota archaeon]
MRISFVERTEKVGIIAEDEFGARSEWIESDVKNKSITNPRLELILEWLKELINSFRIFLN